MNRTLQKYEYSHAWDKMATQAIDNRNAII